MLVALAASIAGVSAYAMRPLPGGPGMTASDTLASVNPQIVNVEPKADRLASLVERALYSELAPSFALAAVAPAPEFDRFYDAAAAPATRTAPSAVAVPDEVAAIPLPPRRPKRPTPAVTHLLDDAQIAGIKNRLRLTQTQAEHWPGVEAALREVARTHLRGRTGGTPNIDVNSPEVQRLIWAAMPLIRQLREDQKREVRQLVRVIGLSQVAAHI